MVKMDELEWIENGIGRKVPKVVECVDISPYCGPFNAVPTKSNKYGPKLGFIADQKSELVASLSEVMDKVGLKNGMTISFHHHFRNGDMVMNMVLSEIEKKGIKDLTLAPSSTFPCQEDAIIRAVQNGKNGKFR